MVHINTLVTVCSVHIMGQIKQNFTKIKPKVVSKQKNYSAALLDIHNNTYSMFKGLHFRVCDALCLDLPYRPGDKRHRG